jgi:hypothetical protein
MEFLSPLAEYIGFLSENIDATKEIESHMPSAVLDEFPSMPLKNSIPALDADPPLIVVSIIVSISDDIIISF